MRFYSMTMVDQVGAPGELAGLRILIVEDDMLQALSYQDMLCEAGAAVVGPYASASDAMAVLGNVTCHVAMIDFSLGNDTAVQLQERLEQFEIPYIVITGYPKVLVRRNPDQTIVGKPVTSEVLCGLLAAKARRH